MCVDPFLFVNVGNERKFAEQDFICDVKRALHHAKYERTGAIR